MAALGDLLLSAHVRACADGDWLIFLDLKHNRYWALPRTLSLTETRATLGAKAMLAESGEIGQTTLAPLPRARLPAPEIWEFATAAMWARRVVARGDLLAAFAWIEAQKASQAAASAGAACALYERFAALRLWWPRPYVCLFDSLCLVRFLIARGSLPSLVFGVRARPFAAHCWVEADGAVLDPGDEDPSSFTEIARV